MSCIYNTMYFVNIYNKIINKAGLEHNYLHIYSKRALYAKTILQFCNI